MPRVFAVSRPVPDDSILLENKLWREKTEINNAERCLYDPEQAASGKIGCRPLKFDVPLNWQTLLERGKIGRGHALAPDKPGFGQSDAPGRDKFAYSFENITEHVDKFLSALEIDRFFMYVFDYGAPIGFRLAKRHPGRILGIISQNGSVYEEGRGSKWTARKLTGAIPHQSSANSLKAHSLRKQLLANIRSEQKKAPSLRMAIRWISTIPMQYPIMLKTVRPDS